jgi:small conductance mechanosensitive channel
MRSKGATARVLFALFALLIALVVMAPPAGAQDERAAVRVDGRTIFRVGPIEELDAEARARRVEQRIATLLENPETIAPAVVEITQPDERIVTVLGVPIVTVTEVDAQDNLTTVDALAVQWAQIINGTLVRGQARRQTTGWPVLILIEGAFTRLQESVIAVVPRALAVLFIITFFGVIAAIMRWLLRFFAGVLVRDLTVQNLIRQVLYYAIWGLGILVAINALGIDPQTAATGIGLTSLALGFALQDILSNFISGILILVLRPFQLRDQIVIGDTEGEVVRIELRATQIRTYDGRIILVPNAELFTSRVTNNTAAPIRRGSVTFYLGYTVELARATAVIYQATQAAEGVLPTPPVFVWISELGQNEIAVEARFWTDSRRADFIATASNVRRAVLAALKEAGIPLPDPSARTVSPRQQAIGHDGLYQEES